MYIQCNIQQHLKNFDCIWFTLTLINTLIMGDTGVNQDESSKVVSSVQTLLGTVAEYVRKSLNVDKLQQNHETTEMEMQQIKTYVLGLEERIAVLEKDVSQHNRDFQTIGTSLADLSDTTKKLTTLNEKKKKHFFSSGR